MSMNSLRRLLKRVFAAPDPDQPIYYQHGFGPGDGPSRVIEPPNYLAERYGLDEKPEGWNEAVLAHFHGSPDNHVRTPEFSHAFKERAHSNINTRLGRTLALAEQFRQAAIKLPAEPDEGVHPIIHDAMRRSFIIQAEQLEAEARALAYPSDRE